MEQEVSQEVIKTTQSTLGKHLKKPPLTDKLLKKPPFRFLHDIVTSILRTTGFFEGLFDEDELISENVKDRDSKIAFLNKVVNVLVSTTGKSINVKPSKIVAGQEPDKTNELLQLIAEALDKNLSSNEAVQKIRSKTNEKTNKAKEVKAPDKTKKVNNEKKLAARSSEKLSSIKKETSSNKNEKTKTNTSKLKEKESKETNARKEKISKKTTVQSKAGEKKSEKILQKEKSLESSNTTNNIPSVLKLDEKTTTKDVEVDLKEEGARDVEESVNSSSNVQVQLNTSYTIAEKDLNITASSNELDNNDGIEVNLTEDNAENNVKSEIREVKLDTVKMTDIANTSIDNLTDRLNGGDDKLPSKELKKNNSEELPSTQVLNDNSQMRPQSMRPSSSRPGAPRVREKHENILAAAETNLLVGKVNIITENTPNEEEEDTSIIIVDQNPVEETAESLQLSSNPRGHLVQQILESQKEYSQSGKTEIEWQFGAHRAREATNQEMEQVRFNIQALSRVANPLGKLLDHIQEDVEVMRQELQQWQLSYNEASQLLSKQKIVNDDSLQPLRTKTKQLDADISEKHEKINDLKVVIYKNATRIDKLLANGNVQ